MLDAVAVHLWNTATPSLSPRMVYAALSLFEAVYDFARGRTLQDDMTAITVKVVG